MKIQQLDPAIALEFFPELQPYVEAALAHDPYNDITMEGVQHQIEHGYCQVLIAVDGEQLLGATLITVNANNAGERELHVVATAGENVRGWLPILIEALRDIARAENAVRVTMSGRPGWGKVVNEYGFKVTHVSMSMEVDDGRVQLKSVKQ